MMAVPRGLGLVAALAVSGTALYLVYGYNKKKALVNIRKGKGSLRLEYRHPNGIQQQQPPLLSTKGSAAVCLQSRERNKVGIVEIYCHHWPCLRRAIRDWRQPETQQQPLLLLAADADAPVAGGSLQGEELLKERLLKCEADAALVKALHTTLASYTVGNQQQQLGEPLRNYSTASSGAGEASESGSFETANSLDNGSAESCGLPETAARDSLLLVPSSSLSSEADDRSSKAVLSTSASTSAGSSSSTSSSSTSSSLSSRSYALVGCFLSSGSGKTVGKQKKVVRFSPSVVEPSSNNQDYRRRFKAQIAQRAALSEQQRTHGHLSAAVIRSIAYDRPRLYSQAAKQTITYNIHHHRYSGRSY